MAPAVHISEQFRFALRTFAAALAVAMLLLSGVADAATCGGEIQDSPGGFSLERGDQLPGQPDAPSDDHQGTCTHGHCHHGNQPLAGDGRGSEIFLARSISLVAAPDDGGPGTVPDLLIPPPRA